MLKSRSKTIPKKKRENINNTFKLKKEMKTYKKTYFAMLKFKSKAISKKKKKEKKILVMFSNQKRNENSQKKFTL
jgi:hypothetical protein